jgi:hypothetical protein
MASRTPASIERKQRLAEDKAEREAIALRWENILCADAEDWTDDDRAFLEAHKDDGLWP